MWYWTVCAIFFFRGPGVIRFRYKLPSGGDYKALIRLTEMAIYYVDRVAGLKLSSAVCVVTGVTKYNALFFHWLAWSQTAASSDYGVPKTMNIIPTRNTSRFVCVLLISHSCWKRGGQKEIFRICLTYVVLRGGCLRQLLFGARLLSPRGAYCAAGQVYMHKSRAIYLEGPGILHIEQPLLSHVRNGYKSSSFAVLIFGDCDALRLSIIVTCFRWYFTQ